MHTITIHTKYLEGDKVFFKVDQEHQYMVIGFGVRENKVSYLLSNPEMGEIEAQEIELQSDRDVF